jgi:hypothetical protein
MGQPEPTSMCTGRRAQYVRSSGMLDQPRAAKRLSSGVTPFAHVAGGGGPPEVYGTYHFLNRVFVTKIGQVTGHFLCEKVILLAGSGS